MSLTHAEAQTALKDIEKTENRAAASQHGRFTAPYLIIWGVIWMIGYLATALRPDFNLVWPVLIAAGSLISALIGASVRRGSSRQGDGFGWRYAVSFATLFVFIFALFAIMKPTETNQVSAFFPLAIGLYYAFTGTWTKGWRMLPLGLAIIALTLVGYFLLPQYFLYWMAIVGGGGLILGGLWLRSA